MFSDRLKQLDLEEIIKKRQSDEDYQVAMAKKLRQLACNYVAGKLKNITEGPAVIGLREFIAAGSLSPIKTVDEFVQSQAKNGVWASNMNFVVEELLGCNIALSTDTSLKQKLPPSTWDKDKQSQTTTLVIKNNNSNTHWEAVIDGKPVKTIGNGNCYYNAVALSLKHETPYLQPTSVVRTTKPGMTEEKLIAIIERQREIEKATKTMVTDDHTFEQAKKEAITTQFEQDCQLALQLAAEELPGYDKKQIDSDYKFAIALEQRSFFGGSKRASQYLHFGKTKVEAPTAA